MKKIIYTACGNSVFGSTKGFQIYTLSRSFTEEERKAAVSYVNTYPFADGAKTSPVRNLYTYDRQLGYIYAQTKPAGMDYSSGRNGNFIGQALISAGNNYILPITVFDDSTLFGGPISKERATGAVPAEYLPDYPPLPRVLPDYGKIDGFFSDRRLREASLLIAEAFTEAVCGGKSVIICDTPQNIVLWIWRATSLLPPSIARLVTFDTYCFDPSSSQEKAVGVLHEGTDYKPERFKDSGRFVLFDFIEKITSFQSKRKFYFKYLSTLKTVKQLAYLHSLCEQELAASAPKNAADFLDDMARLDYFLNADVAEIFTSTSEEAATRRKQLVEAGKKLWLYHSPKLVSKVMQRIKDIVGLGGKWQTLTELLPILSAPEVYTPYHNEINAAYFDYLNNVFEKHGATAMFEFMQALDKKFSGTKMSAALKNHMWSILIKSPTFAGTATAADMANYLRIMVGVNQKGYIAASGCIPDYLMLHPSAAEYRAVAEILLNEKADRNLEEHLPALINLYTKIIAIGCGYIGKDDLIFKEVIAESYALNKLIINYKVNNLDMVGFCKDKAIDVLEKADANWQRLGVNSLINSFGGDTYPIYVRIFASRIDKGVRMELIDKFIGVCKQEISLNSRPSSDCYKAVQIFGSKAVLKMFTAFYMSGNPVKTCVEFARYGNEGLLALEEVRDLFADAVLKSWLNVFDENTDNGDNFKTCIAFTQNSFKELENACKRIEEGERKEILFYFAQILFYKALDYPKIFLHDDNFWDFFDKHKNIISDDGQMAYGLMLIKLFAVEGATAKNRERFWDKILKTCNNRGGVQSWKDVRIPQALRAFAKLNKIELNLTCVKFLANRFAFGAAWDFLCMEDQFKIGKQYYTGEDAEEDFKAAAEWFTKSAEKGYDKAQCYLGICYYKGQGVQKDYVAAVKLFSKSVGQGNCLAYYFLGTCYFNGQGVPQNYEQAAELFKVAADQNYGAAQYSLGICYRDGCGTQKDIKEAVGWFTKAAGNGYPDAKAELEKLKNKK